MYLKVLVFSFLAFYCHLLMAAPLESIIMRPKPVKGLFGGLNVISIDSYWEDGYSTADISLGVTDKNHFYSGGYKSSFDTEVNKRDSWFLNYELLLSKGYSMSIKYIHDNWYWLSSGKESLGIAYNVATDLGLYYSVGYYMRWLKQSWDPTPYIPFTFDTEDKEGFLSLILGIKYKNTRDIYWTIDINNRDLFSFYSSDHWAIDFKYFFKVGHTTYFNLLAGVRLTGLTGLAPYPGSAYTGIGLQY